jgi:hypothetical protein
MDQEASGENKPQPKQEGQIINLIVKDQMGSEVHFKVKSHTKLEKVRAWQAAHHCKRLVVAAIQPCYLAVDCSTWLTLAIWL